MRLPALLLGLLFLSGLPLGASQNPPVDNPPLWEMPDEAGDQFVDAGTGSGRVPVPPSTATAHADLRRITIDEENEEHLRVTFHVETLRVRLQSGASPWVSVSCPTGGGSSGEPHPGLDRADHVYQLNFALDRTPYRYRLVVRVHAEMATDGQSPRATALAAMAYMCVVREQGGPGGTRVQPVDVQLADNRIIATVSKAALQSRLSSPFPFVFGATEPYPISLAAGERLVNFSARAAHGRPQDLGGTNLLAIQDVAPNTGIGPAYVLRAAAANTHIEIRLPQRAAQVPVAIGNDQTLSIQVENRMPEKRLIALRYELDGPEDKRKHYRAEGPQSVTVAGGSTQTVIVSLAVDADARPDDNVSLAIRGFSAGRAGEVGLARFVLFPAPVLGPGQENLFFHTRALQRAGSTLLNSALCQVPTQANSCYEPFLSLVPDDGRARRPNRQPVPVYPAFPQAWQAFIRFAQLVDGLPLPANLDPARPFEVVLKLRNSVEVSDVRVRASMFVTNKTGFGGLATPLFEGTATGRAGPSDPSLTITAPSLWPANQLIPAGSFPFLALHVYLDTPAAGAGTLAGLEIVGGQSYARFPLRPLPPGALAPAAAGPVTLQLEGSGEDFVNPAKARRFNFTLANHGDEPRRVSLAATTDPDTWTAQVYPGTEFQLEPGDALRLPLLLKAPAEAREGEVGLAWLNASSGPEQYGGIHVRAIAITGIPLPDDSEGLVVDEEARARAVRDEPPKTPGIGVVAAALAVAAAAARAPRRR